MNLKKTQKKYSFLSFVLFTFWIGVYKFLYHELWKDEWQAWFVASDQNLGEMFSFLNYEGHPALFYLYLKLSSLFEGLAPNQPEMIIQLTHLILVALMAYVFFVKFKMPLILKILLGLGYCFAFEYSVVNRGYVLVMFFAFWITTMIEAPSKYPWQLPLAIFLLCQTEVYGVLIAIPLVFYILLEANDKPAAILKSIHKSQSFLSLMFGFLIFVITVYPRGNRDDFSRAYQQSWFDLSNIMDAFQGYLTNNFLVGSVADTSRHGSSAIGLLLALIVLAALVWILWNKKKLLLTFVLGFLAFYSFGVIIYNGGVRQWGMFYIFFICLIELYDFKLEKSLNLRLVPIFVFASFQIFHSFKSFHRDYIQEFTNAELTAEFIKAKVPENVPIVALNKFESTPVIGYADRAFYELPSGELFTYFKWLEKVYVPTQSELQLFSQFKKVRGIILLSPKPIDQGRFPNAQLWESFVEPNYKQENYYLYTLSKE